MCTLPMATMLFSLHSLMTFRNMMFDMDLELTHLRTIDWSDLEMQAKSMVGMLQLAITNIRV